MDAVGKGDSAQRGGDGLDAIGTFARRGTVYADNTQGGTEFLVRLQAVSKRRVDQAVAGVAMRVGALGEHVLG